MGVIKRQSIKQSIVSFLGVGIGVISTIWIYPNNLEIYGLSQFLVGTASLLYPILSFGVVGISIKLVNSPLAEI